MTATPTRHSSRGTSRGQRRPEPDLVNEPASGYATDEDFDFDAADGIAVATGSTYPRMEDLEDCLLLIEPYEKGSRASKRRDAPDYIWIEADAWVLKIPESGWPTDKFEDPDLPFALEGFQFTGGQVTSFLERQMRKRTPTGDPMVAVGVLVKGEPTGGNNPPWILETPSQDEVILAARFWKAHKAAKEQADVKSGSAFAR